MIVMTEDKISNVKLSDAELRLLIDSLQDVSYRMITFYGDTFEELHRKLQIALGGEGK